MNYYSKDMLSKFLDKTLKETSISDFQKVNIDNDSDINYILVPNLDENTKLNILLYCTDKKTLTLFCPILYKTKYQDSIIFTLNVINTVNSRMAVGKLYLNQQPDLVVSYINRILFNNILNELTPKLLDEYIESFLLTAFDFFNTMKTRTHE